jgi:hypothetical protein
MEDSRMRTLWLLPLAFAVGCASPDIMIHNPITVRAVDSNRIVRPHDYIERQRGLPPGSVADEASMTSADGERVCFAITMHELAPIDLRAAEASLRAPKADSVNEAQVWADPPTFQTYDGLIPERQQVGTETVCSYRDQYGNCQSWRTQPLYATVYIRGPVNVYQTRGSLCFPNRNVFTAITEMLTLEVKVRRQGLMAGSKGLAFHWGFSK